MARCQLCYNLEKKEADNFRLAFDFAPEQLLASKDSQECVSCALILEGILRFEDETWTFAKHTSRVYVYALESGGDSLTLEIYFKEDRPKLVLEFFIPDGEDRRDNSLSWKAIQPRTSVTGYPVLPNGVRWVNSVLKTCLTTHKSCPPIRETLLPKRVLAFEKYPSGEISVRVQENQGQKGIYNALSHCWGSSQTCVATSKTLREYKKAIPWIMLPTTFRDSIIFSLELGIDHIWIDALCIVQDDPSDWEIESAKMADIYQYAFMTLAATASSSGTGGCFSVNHIPVREYSLDSGASLMKLSSIMVRKKVTHWTVPPTNISMQSHPLLSRGWAFQERNLSPRVLHFCTQELVWECTEETICECGGISATFDRQERLLLLMSDRQVKFGEEEVDSTDEQIESSNREINSSSRGAGSIKEEVDSSKEGVDSGKEEVTSDNEQIISSNKEIDLSNSKVGSSHKEVKSISDSNFGSRKSRKILQKLRAHKLQLLRRNAPDYKIADMPSSQADANLAVTSFSPHDSKVADISSSFSGFKLAGLSASPPDSNIAETSSRPPDYSITAKSFWRPEPSSLQIITEQWHSIVEQYSALKLTKETDRLPALSGLAERASPRLGQYFCGLWFNTFISDLLWRVPTLDYEFGRPAKYTGPSWSWVSVKGPVKYWQDLDNEREENETIYRLETQDLDSTYEKAQAMRRAERIRRLKASLQSKAENVSFECTVHPAGKNPFGEVSGGCIEMQGYLQGATLKYVYSRLGYYSEITHDPLKYQVEIHGTDVGSNLELPFFADYVLRKEPHELPQGTALCLLLVNPYICLVLKPLGLDPTFERIGIIRQPSALPLLYCLDWMKNSIPMQIMII